MASDQISFDLSNPDSPKNFRFAVCLASLAYKTQPEIEASLRKHGYSGTDVLFVRHPLLSCFILRWDDVTAIAFKGSTSWREWLNNLNVWPQATDRGRIHAGYLYTIQRFGPILYRLICSDILSCKGIVLTGHSRGGAIALLFASLLAINGHRAHSVWGFGSPMVGDKEFVSLLNVPVKLYRNGPDPVTSFPPNINSNLAIIKWLMQFKVIYISLSLVYFLLREVRIGKYLMRFAPIKCSIALYRSIRQAFVRSEKK
jgi:predicted lipase